MPETIYVATEEHVVPLRFGGTMTIPVGFWVAAGHPLMTEPDKWRVGTRPDSVERSTTPSRALEAVGQDDGLPGAVPEITRRDDPEEVVLLHGGAVGRMAAEASDSSDGGETGGWLLGSDRGRDDTEIWAATGPGERARFSPTSVGLDLYHRIAVEQRLRDQDSDLLATGCFHTHLGQDPKPSLGDRTAWASNFQMLEKQLGARAAWTGVIVTSDADTDWRHPDFHAFVVRRDWSTRRLICENGIVKEL
jgi:Prokaryotic homologs of the JAB domain